MNSAEGLYEHIQWERTPELKAPILVAGFQGWSDAGEVSTATLNYFAEELHASVFARVSLEPFINFTLDRPVALIRKGLVEDVESMATDVYAHSSPTAKHDLVLLLSKEPQTNWQLFARTIVAMVKRLGVEKVYTIGGVQDTISHSSAPQCSIVGSSEDAVQETTALQSGITAAEYQGPISIHTCLIRTAHEHGITAVSLWGHVPAYLQKAPRLVAKLVSLISDVTGCHCPTEPLIKQALELDRKIEEALAKDPNLKQFVEALETHENSGSPSHDRDKIIRLNEFLRRDGQRDPKQ